MKRSLVFLILSIPEPCVSTLPAIGHTVRGLRVRDRKRDSVLQAFALARKEFVVCVALSRTRFRVDADRGGRVFNCEQSQITYVQSLEPTDCAIALAIGFRLYSKLNKA